MGVQFSGQSEPAFTNAAVGKNLLWVNLVGKKNSSLFLPFSSFFFLPIYWSYLSLARTSRPPYWQTNSSPNINLSPNILVDLSQFFSILSDLECYRSSFWSFTSHLSNARPKEQPKKSNKKKRFVELQNVVIFIFLHFDPSYFINA